MVVGIAGTFGSKCVRLRLPQSSTFRAQGSLQGDCEDTDRLLPLSESTGVHIGSTLVRYAANLLCLVV